MIIVKYPDDLRSIIQKEKLLNLSIGFIPTMGALHPGHISLLKKSKETCSITVASIFINPTQFNNADDFKKYPVSPEKDIYELENNGCDILFMPSVKEMYPEGTEPKKHFDIGYLENILEGKFRPGHFQGVCQIVKQLLNMVQPTHLFLGQKDYQQCLVINNLIQSERINCELVICPTVRETNGLAMSSRNMRLSEQQKNNASIIYKSLLGVKQKLQAGSLINIKNEAKENLIKNNLQPDYVEIADAGNLKPVNEWDGRQPLVMLAAAFAGEVRLIDNILLA